MFRTIFRIASGHLLGRRRQTLTTLVGVAVSTMVLITTISLMRGLVDSFTESIVDITPHIIIRGEPVIPETTDLITGDNSSKRAFVTDNVQKEDPEEVTNYRQILTLVAEAPYDKLVQVASPYVSSQVMGIKGTANEPMQVIGVLIERENLVSKIEGNLKSGSIEQLQKTPDGILVGQTIADNIDLKLNDEITIVASSGVTKQVKVVGTFSTGIKSIDNSAFVNLKVGQLLERMPPNKVTGINLRVRDLLKNTALARELERVTGYRCETWQEANESVIGLFNRIGYIVFALVGFVALVSGFGVANILVTTIYEKTRDIAIMKSFGFTARQIVGLFVLEGVLVGLIGA
ncbi:MAG: ABC transporter permease, partial [Chlorobiales bacterium]|nr:ABC transporter permease [Chlorobiales bacterium]